MLDKVFNKYEVSQPYVYKNLTVFMLFGEDKSEGRTFLTLQESLEEEKIKVNETGVVSELVVESFSNDSNIFIQSGDIVKGGKQDRAIRFDYVILPNATIPVVTCCVERERWEQRGTERVAEFSSSKDRVTLDLGVSIKRKTSQQEVWQTVGQTQRLLGKNLRTSVTSNVSSSSFQLTLEETPVKEKVEESLNKLISIINHHPDAIGYVFVVNNKILTSDIYFSQSLFKKLWPKLLKAAILEALLHQGTEITLPQVTIDDVKQFLDNENNDFNLQEDNISEDVKMYTREFKDKVRFDTIDKKLMVCLHSNCVYL